MAKRKFIAKAIKREGRVKAMAARQGGLTAEGTVKQSWLRKAIARLKGKKGNRSLMSALVLARRFKSGDLAGGE